MKVKTMKKIFQVIFDREDVTLREMLINPEHIALVKDYTEVYLGQYSNLVEKSGLHEGASILKIELINNTSVLCLGHFNSFTSQTYDYTAKKPY